MSFGGGGGGNQTVTQEFKPPEYTKSGWQDYINAGKVISQTPYQQSGLATVAPINDYQNTAMQLMYNRALYGAPDLNAARGAAMNASQGNYANPWAQNVSGIASGQAYNPAMEGYYNLTQSGANPYAEQMNAALGGYANLAQIGANPYTSPEYVNDLIARQANTMAQGFAAGTAAQNDAAAAMAGAYGGTGHQQKQTADASALAQQIGNMASQTLAQQQQYAGNMWNQDFANTMSALGGYSQQALNAGNMWNQDFANQMAALGGYSQAYMGDVANQLQANAQGGGMWNSDIGNILSGAGLAGSLSQQDFTAYQGLMNAGNTWNSYYQQLLDGLNKQWDTQNQYDANMNEYLGSVLGRASGSWGSTASTQPGQSNLASLLGLGATAAGIYKLF